MTTRQIVARAAGVIVAVGALLGAGNVAQATEHSGNGSKAEARAIEGVWLPIVTITDCQHASRDRHFPVDGNLRSRRRLHRVWCRHAVGPNRHGRLAAHRRPELHGPVPVLRLHPVRRPGRHARRDVAQGLGNDPAQCRRYRIRPAPSTAEVVDTAGNVLAQTCGTRTATRLQ